MILNNSSKIYFIGIGGIAMSATAGIAKELGHDVLGSDSKAIYDPAKTVLDSLQISYYIGYSVANIAQANADIYIASAGEDLSNPEMAYLQQQGIDIFSLSELLYTIAQDKLRLVVAGTHGKSTTTAILGKVLKSIDDSSFMTGAVLINENRNYHLGAGHYFAFEGDEYKALFDDPTPKFQQYKADIAILTNLEFDHPDIFSNLDELSMEFTEMLNVMPPDGLVVYNNDSAELNKLVYQSHLSVVSFGIDQPANYRAQNMQTFSDHTEFDVYINSLNGKLDVVESYSINIFGKINVYNSLGVIATLRTLGFNQAVIQSGLNEFLGIKRRFEYMGDFRGAKIIDDYAHHPTAVKETLATARLRYPQARIWAIFEPHTFSRTQALLPEFVESFALADQFLLANIYPARESVHDIQVSSKDILQKLKQINNTSRIINDKNEVKKILSSEVKKGDVVIIMAVGNFNSLAKDLVDLK